VQSKSFLFLFIFTLSLAAPIAIQYCFHSSDFTSLLSLEEESKTDTFELETEKITENLFVSLKPLWQTTLTKKALKVRTVFWNTIYTEPTAPPPQML
jgi:hypothetical protein